MDLTDRDIEMARLVSEGKTNKEIATAFGLKHRTVHTRLTLIYKELGLDAFSLRRPALAVFYVVWRWCYEQTDKENIGGNSH